MIAGSGQQLQPTGKKANYGTQARTRRIEPGGLLRVLLYAQPRTKPWSESRDAFLRTFFLFYLPYRSFPASCLSSRCRCGPVSGVAPPSNLVCILLVSFLSLISSLLDLPVPANKTTAVPEFDKKRLMPHAMYRISIIIGQLALERQSSSTEGVWVNIDSCQSTSTRARLKRKCCGIVRQAQGAAWHQLCINASG